MKTEEFFAELASLARDNEYRFEDLRARLPLGVDGENRLVVAGRRESRRIHTCVTGTGRTEFIRRLILSLAGAYDRGQTTFVILSPKREYAELLRLTRSNVFVPVISSVEDLWKGVEFARSQAGLRRGDGESVFGRLVLIADGLESVTGGGLDGYLPFFSIAAEYGVTLVTGVDLIKSVFGAVPQHFVGAGNCLITVMSAGKAHLSRVTDEGTLALPQAFTYPSEPSFSDSLAFVEKL